jgi:hypothetical protein
MHVFVLAILMALVRGLTAALKQRPRQKPSRPLCAECASVHMQFGATGRNEVFCTFGGGVRPVKLDVLYCTDYRDRNVPRAWCGLGSCRTSRVLKRGPSETAQARSPISRGEERARNGAPIRVPAMLYLRSVSGWPALLSVT